MTTTEENSVYEEPPSPQRPEHDPEEAITTPEQVDPPTAEAERLCDPFIDSFPSMMNHDNISAVLDEQAHM